MALNLETVQPPLPPIVTSDEGGTIPAGLYKYVCTWIGVNGFDWAGVPVQPEETRISSPTEWTADGVSKAIISKPSNHPSDAVGWMIYRSKIGGQIDPVVKFIHYYALCTILPLTQESYTDNALDNTLVLDAGELSCTYGTRLYIDTNVAAVNATYNTSFGLYSLQRNNVGQFNSAFGRGSLGNNTSGKHNTANGCDSLKACTKGSYNVASGVDCLQQLTTGSNNSAYGFGAANATNGDANCAFGKGALTIGKTPIANNAFGVTALMYSTGNFNSAFGAYAGRSITSGSYNLFLGDNSGFNPLQKVNPNNSVAIGANSFTTKDNQIVIGNGGITETILKGMVKLPEYDLQLKIQELENKISALEAAISNL